MSFIRQLADRGVPIPPGDDSWNRENDLPPQPFDLWTRVNVGENLPFPVTPLTETHFPALFKLDEANTKPDSKPVQMSRRMYGRLYFNEGAIVRTVTEEYGLPSSFLDRMWGSRRRGKAAVSNTFRPLQLLRNLPAALGGGLKASRKGPRQTPEQFFAQIDQWVTTFLQKDLIHLDDQQLWAEGLPIWRERGEHVFATNLRISMPSGMIVATLTWLVKWWTGQKELTQDVITGQAGIYSAEVGPALWRMAQALQTAGLGHVLLENEATTALLLLNTLPEGKAFSEQLKQFLDRHGHRCPNELELLNPRWSEAPEQVVKLVTYYLQAGASVNPLEAEDRQRQRCARATALIEKRLDPLRRAIFRFVLKRAQRAVAMRDNSRYYVTKFYFPMRKLYAQFGQRWVARGWLKRDDDIFFLTVAEIRNLVEEKQAVVSAEELQTRINKRRVAYTYWFTVVPPDALEADGTPVIEERSASASLKGVAASSGRVCGRARIVQSVHEAMRLSLGDILVTQATDPGWTPVFPLVSGIVLEIGGQLSHGAIVAREYAIPAVVNVPGVMQRIQDGQVIEVDGTNGLIHLVDTTDTEAVPVR